MPYKDPKKQAEYMHKYRTPYMREYRERQQREIQQLKAKAEKYDLLFGE